METISNQLKSYKENNSRTKKVLCLTGGGTMGHISPHLSLLPELKKNFDKIIYIGSKDSMEESKAKEYSLPFFSIPTVKFDRKNLLKNLKIPFILSRAKKQVKQILSSNNVSLVFSKGGYVSLPVMLSAQKLKIPNILHESDMTLGLANKISSKKATCILTSTEKAKNSLPKKFQKKAVTVGLPTSDKFLYLNKSQSKIKPKTNKKIMIVTGGSQGASAINNFIQDNLNWLLDEFEIYHIVGKGKINKSIKNKDYHQLEFVLSLSDYFLSSDIVISRAGATTIFEGIKSQSNMLLIPLPKSKHSRGDQVDNAKYFSGKNLVHFILQENLNTKTFKEALENIKLSKEFTQKNMISFNKSQLNNKQFADFLVKFNKS